MASQPIVSPTAPEPVGAYPHARKVGDLIFLSGVGPRQKGIDEIPGVRLNDKGNFGRRWQQPGKSGGRHGLFNRSAK